MRGKRWDLQLGDTLHLLHFEHGRFWKRNRKLLVDGEPAQPLTWRVYDGKTPVTEYPFIVNDLPLTVVVRYLQGKPCYDLLLNGISVETGQPVDLLALSTPKTKMDKLKEYLLYAAIVVVWRVAMEFFAAAR